jgi:hypothetical protein
MTIKLEFKDPYYGHILIRADYNTETNVMMVQDIDLRDDVQRVRDTIEKDQTTRGEK